MPVSLNVNTYTAKSNYHDSSDPNEYDSDLATINQVSNSNRTLLCCLVNICRFSSISLAAVS
jgi:hypothetical protein